MILRREVEVARASPARLLDILRLVDTLGHIGGGKIGNGGQPCLDRVGQRLFLGFQVG